MPLCIELLPVQGRNHAPVGTLVYLDTTKDEVFGVMKVLIDSREQLPFTFSDSVETEVTGLAVGDYSLAGHEDQIAIERKSLSDLLGSITNGRERFIRELRHMRAYRFAAIIVEASWGEILRREYMQRVHPNAVMGSLSSFAIKYGVLTIMAGSRHQAARITESLLHNYSRFIEAEWKALEGSKSGV